MHSSEGLGLDDKQPPGRMRELGRGVRESTIVGLRATTPERGVVKASEAIGPPQKWLHLRERVPVQRVRISESPSGLSGAVTRGTMVETDSSALPVLLVELICQKEEEMRQNYRGARQF